MTTISYDESVKWNGYGWASAWLGLLAFFGIFNNMVVLVAYFLNKKLKELPLNILLINLCFVGMVVSIFGTPLTLASTTAERWLFGNGCAWDGFIIFLSGVATIYTLTVVSIERYIMIKSPSMAKLFSKRQAISVVFSIWVISILIALGPLVGWNKYTLEASNTACGIDWESRDLNSRSFIIFMLCVVLIVPSTTMLVVYTLLIIEVWKNGNTVASRSIQGANKVEKRVLVMVIVMVLCFFACWIPFAVTSIILMSGGKLSTSASFLPSLFAKGSNVINPIIYFLLNSNFQTAIIKMLCCGRVLSSEVSVTETNSSRTGDDINMQTKRNSRMALSSSPSA